MKNECIQDYILKSERNLAVAAAVGEAWPEAREELVSRFLDQLESRLKKKLKKGWKFERWGGRFFMEAYPGFYISKPTWAHHSIGFQCGERGNQLVKGVSRDTSDTRKLPLHAPLLNAVQQIHPSAKSTAWWEALVTMRSPEPDWRKPEALWRMHKEAAFLTDVADQLLEIVEVSERIIDRLPQKK